nr:saccharopine dehydrogenase NADP-binding domain-containing protein [Ramlibacter albus]
MPLPLSGATRLFAIIGDPIEQAGSPGLFNQAFRKHGIPAVLVPMQVPPSAVPGAIALFRQSANWDGLVVTVPHKVAVCALVDELAPAARLTGAVNAIRKESDGRLVGDNYDGAGFIEGLRQHGHALQGRHVLMVGAGGAGRAIAHAIAAEGAASITLVDRDGERARQLAEAVGQVHPKVAVSARRQGDEDTQRHDVIVNCAPPDGDKLPVDLSAVRSGTLVVDIVLKPAWTPLLAAAGARGLPTHAGVHMLSGQVDALLGFFGLSP